MVGKALRWLRAIFEGDVCGDRMTLNYDDEHFCIRARHHLTDWHMDDMYEWRNHR